MTKAQLEEIVSQMSQAEINEILRRLEQREVLFFGGVLALLAAAL